MALDGRKLSPDLPTIWLATPEQESILALMPSCEEEKSCRGLIGNALLSVSIPIIFVQHPENIALAVENFAAKLAVRDSALIAIIL